MSKTEEFISVLKRHQADFHTVVPFDHNKYTLLVIDFTENNKNDYEDILDDTKLFINFINQQLNTAEAKYGIGGYAEHRTVYSRSRVFDGKQPNEEPRRLHLGINIWGKPHTAVMAPLDGIVHSFAFE